MNDVPPKDFPVHLFLINKDADLITGDIFMYFDSHLQQVQIFKMCFHPYFEKGSPWAEPNASPAERFPWNDLEGSTEGHVRLTLRKCLFKTLF